MESNLTFIVYTSIIVSVLLITCLNKFPAPYGKFKKASGVFSSVTINSKLAWSFQECPAFIIPFYIFLMRMSSLSWLSTCAFVMFCVHYLNRSFIYPFFIKSQKETPLETCVSAFMFCSFNGWLQSISIIENDFSHRELHASLIGILLFCFGMYINISSDFHLHELASHRAGNEYLLPNKGMFKYVSAANYFGEIVEWFGYALFIQTPSAAWFSLFTTLFLGQRGYQTHKYYQKNITDYPKRRSSIFPFCGF